jgi:glycerophosphoryl diester phosphodiesterase
MELHRGARGVMRIGHRGAALLAPESSLEAIEAAAGCGADAVELDLQRGLVVAHGPEIPADAPRLDDALALAGRLGLAVQLDVKVGGLERDAVAALRRHDLLEQSFVSSFSTRILAAFAAAEPSLPRSLTYPEDRLRITTSRLVSPVMRPVLAALRTALPARLPRMLGAVRAQGATLHWSVVSPRAIEVCHRLGVAVLVWTVNDPAVAKTLVERGADAIISDDPRIVPADTPTST